MLAFSSDWTTLAGWRGLKTRLNSLRYIKGRVAKPDARHRILCVCDGGVVVAAR